MLRVRTLYEHPLRAHQHVLGLNKYDVSTFNELRGLRNQAVHSAQFEIDSGTIGSYVDVALSLARRIEKLSSNHNEGKA